MDQELFDKLLRSQTDKEKIIYFIYNVRLK
jgi:hypothetical protein